MKMFGNYLIINSFLFATLFDLILVKAEINCFQCKGEQCEQDQKIINKEASPCEDGKEEYTGCFIRIEENGSTSRGCGEECVSLPFDRCEHTKAEENYKIYPENRKQCLQCENCENVVEGQEPKVCPNYDKNDNCYTRVEGKTIKRGCISTNKGSCEKPTICCDTNACNIQSIGTCFQCEGDECRGSTASTSDTTCSFSDTDSVCKYPLSSALDLKCYSYLKDNQIFRGCAKPQEEGISIKECEGEKCNKDCYVTECITCDSKNSQTCKDTEKTTEKCKALSTTCNSCKEDADLGHIIRGCSGDDIQEDKFTCMTCSANICNEGKINKFCLKCNSKDDPKCSQGADLKSTVCDTADESCYSLVDTDGQTQRGCLKEIGEDKCKEGQENCSKCIDTACNSGVFPNNRTKCFQCDTKNVAECDKPEEKQLTMTACRLYKSDDKCFTYDDQEAVVKTRGCLSDQFGACKSETDKNCKTCTGNGCNRELRKCIRCRSDKKGQESCAEKGEGIDPERCINQFSSKTVCYAEFFDDVFYRGCFDDITDKYQRLNCENENYNACVLCEGDGCNTNLISGSSYMRPSFFMIIALTTLFFTC